MAQASSAQREPSMEEILASIRRIIEDSDTYRRPDEEHGVRAEPERDTPVAEPAARSVVEIDSFRVERAPQVVEATLPTQSDTLAGMNPEAGRETPPAPVEPHAPMERFDAVSGSKPSLADDLDIEDDLRADSHPVAAGAPSANPASKLPITPMQMNETHLRSQAEPALAGIMSERAGRQVAAAFGELSEAFTASRKRSFDEIAEDMMRP